MNSINQPQTGMQLYDAQGRRLYFTEDERRAFLATAAHYGPKDAQTGLLSAGQNPPRGTENMPYLRAMHDA